MSAYWHDGFHARARPLARNGRNTMFRAAGVREEPSRNELGPHGRMRRTANRAKMSVLVQCIEVAP
jgi:hypothetical protein